MNGDDCRQVGVCKRSSLLRPNSTAICIKILLPEAERLAPEPMIRRGAWIGKSREKRMACGVEQDSNTFSRDAFSADVSRSGVVGMASCRLADAGTGDDRHEMITVSLCQSRGFAHESGGSPPIGMRWFPIQPERCASQSVRSAAVWKSRRASARASSSARGKAWMRACCSVARGPKRRSSWR